MKSKKNRKSTPAKSQAKSVKKAAKALVKKAAKPSVKKAAKAAVKKAAPKAKKIAKKVAKAPARKVTVKAVKKPVQPKTPKYLNLNLSFEERAADLISRMTLEEKVSQLVHFAPAIERLGVPKHVWWNECLHGIGRAGIATVFPQAIGMAAMWNKKFLHQIASTIADEGRAKHHQANREGKGGEMYYGLTFWTPNINIFRDPRWGRGHETYGEDPHLNGRLGVEFCKGIQGDDPKYFKAVSTPKHFAAHSGPEATRASFNSIVSQRDLRETYLPHFKVCVQEAKAWSVMGAYNRLNGEACNASYTLLEKILRQEWGFKGYVVSDCGAICFIYKSHRLVDTVEEAAALALKNGCDLSCDDAYLGLRKAVMTGMIDEATLDKSLNRLFYVRFKLGHFDPPEMVKYAQIPFTVNDSKEHRELAAKAARESMVLLNNNGILPLARGAHKKIAVMGPNANNIRSLIGNYNGETSKAVTILEGITNKVTADGAAVTFFEGCHLYKQERTGFDQAVQIARESDLVIACMGLTPQLEGEEGDAEANKSGDRVDITMPGVQEEFLQALHATGKPIILVLTGGSCIAVNWANENVPAILMSWYGGEEQGTAVADILWGDYNPAGRTPVTWYTGLEQVPPFEDYSMKGRTYRFFDGKPLYPFGHGLSYTRFEYGPVRVSDARVPAGASVTVSVDVSNVGDRDGDEVVQLYVKDVQASVPVPRMQLQGFDRISLKAGETKTVTFTLKPQQMSCWTDEGKEMVEPGTFEVFVGGGQPGFAATQQASFELTGQTVMLPK